MLISVVMASHTFPEKEYILDVRIRRTERIRLQSNVNFTVYKYSIIFDIITLRAFISAVLWRARGPRRLLGGTRFYQ